VQIDSTFLTGKYHGALLTAIGLDDNRNMFPLAFALGEGETKETLIWFFQFLQAYVTPQRNICLITDRGTIILSTFQSVEVGWKWMVSSQCIAYVTLHLTSIKISRMQN